MEFDQLNLRERSSEALEEVSDDLETVGNESAEPKVIFSIADGDQCWKTTFITCSTQLAY